jgi:hypothetical protein
MSSVGTTEETTMSRTAQTRSTRQRRRAVTLLALSTAIAGAALAPGAALAKSSPSYILQKKAAPAYHAFGGSRSSVIADASRSRVAAGGSRSSVAAKASANYVLQKKARSTRSVRLISF